jgi:hypothetical protein
MRDRDDEVEFEPFDALLEEAVAAAAPAASRAAWRSRAWIAAVLLLGVGVVTAVAIEHRAAPALPRFAQEPQQKGQPELAKPKDADDYLRLLDTATAIRLRVAEPVLMNRQSFRMQVDERCSYTVQAASVPGYVAALRAAAADVVTHQSVDRPVELLLTLRDGRALRGWLEFGDKKVVWIEGLDDREMQLPAAFVDELLVARTQLERDLRLREGKIQTREELAALPVDCERLVLPAWSSGDIKTSLARLTRLRDLEVVPSGEMTTHVPDLLMLAAPLPAGIERLAVRRINWDDLMPPGALGTAIVQAPESLRALTCEHNRAFTGLAFAKLPQLREVHLIACPDLTAAGLDALARLRLDTLEVRGGAAIAPRLRSLFATLRRMTIGDDAGFDDAQLEVALSSKLDELHLPHTGVTIAGVRKLRDLPTLRLLELTGCAITDDDIAELARFEHLRELDVTDTKITDRGLADLRERMPKTIVRASWRQEPLPPMK